MCCSKYYQNDFRCEAKVPRREALASDNLALILKICENCPTNHLKAEKIGVKEAISSLFAILCFLPLPQIWSYEFLLSTGTGEGTNMFNGPANLKRYIPSKETRSVFLERSPFSLS